MAHSSVVGTPSRSGELGMSVVSVPESLSVSVPVVVDAPSEGSHIPGSVLEEERDVVDIHSPKCQDRSQSYMTIPLNTLVSECETISVHICL